MRRREFIGALATMAVLPRAARAQGSPRTFRIGVLNGGTEAGTKERDACFYDGLRKLGWIEGQNIVIERRWADGDTARLPALAAELIRLKPDLIATSGTPSAQAAQRATDSIPVVFNMVSDPVASGIVTNLARPDTNVTGVSNFFPAMISKLLELIGTVSGAQRIDPVGIHGPDDVDAAFAAMAKTPPGALIVLVDGITLGNKQRIVTNAAQIRLPAIYQERTFVEAGGLMSYALNYCQHFQRAADYVDKILKGRKPSDLPIEQPATFQFVVNLKAAKLLGLNLPPSILAFADEIME